MHYYLIGNGVCTLAKDNYMGIDRTMVNSCLEILYYGYMEFLGFYFDYREFTEEVYLSYVNCLLADWEWGVYVG